MSDKLIEAVFKSDIGAVRSLLRSGIDPRIENGRGETLLARCLFPDMEIALRLLRLGEHRHINLSDHTSDEIYSLVYDYDRCIDIASLLVQHGAMDEDLKDTLVVRAINSKNKTVIDFLNRER
jgi:hypothetical protein